MTQSRRFALYARLSIVSSEESATLPERAALLRSVWVAVEVSRGRPGPRRADPDRFRFVDEVVPERRR